jgi:hypothetical protein
LVGLAGASSVATAKNSRTFDYRFDSIWSSTIRMLRVDRGYKITDKDRDNGYVLFVFPGTGAVKQCPASLEIVPFADERGFRRQRVQLQIAHQPSYIEVNVLDALETKLRDDHGDPPPAQRDDPKTPPKKPDDKPAPPKDSDGN